MQLKMKMKMKGWIFVATDFQRPLQRPLNVRWISVSIPLSFCVFPLISCPPWMFAPSAPPAARAPPQASVGSSLTDRRNRFRTSVERSLQRPLKPFFPKVFLFEQDRKVCCHDSSNSRGGGYKPPPPQGSSSGRAGLRASQRDRIGMPVPSFCDSFGFVSPFSHFLDFNSFRASFLTCSDISGRDIIHSK